MEKFAVISHELDLRQENAQLRASLHKGIDLLTGRARSGDRVAKLALVNIERIATEPFPYQGKVVEDLLYVRINLQRRKKIVDQYSNG